VSRLVDGAFDELECVGTDEHSGANAAYIVWHDCFAGMLCASHFKAILDVTVPQIAEQIAFHGYCCCGYCDKYFRTASDLMKMYPL
jgi:hypothetical protein